MHELHAARCRSIGSHPLVEVDLMATDLPNVRDTLGQSS